MRFRIEAIYGQAVLFWQAEVVVKSSFLSNNYF